ncbi:MAG TPA: SprT family zinc-dependent metalloprotease [Candidatus Saccharimonadales bacterium]|nr:SprT family zinc-dependent metalloprotease [Candidatus Saccharimonadales bacterium]
MPYKEFLLENQLPVRIYKRRKARHLRLSIDAAGNIKVSVPAWASYRSGLDFAKSKNQWIQKNYKPKDILDDGQPIGKAHHLAFKPSLTSKQPTVRISGSLITITHPATANISDDDVQAAAERGSLRALKYQAETLLPQRLNSLALKHRLEYNSLSIKKMKSRWGSCDINKDIVLNLFLMQVPWELIDYVIIHELTHTQVLRHGPDFWNYIESLLPDAKSYRKKLRSHQPVMNGSPVYPVS